MKSAPIHILLIVGGLLISRSLFLFLMPPGAVSVDMNHWLVANEILSTGGNPYNSSSYLNWPPLWMQIISGLSFLGNLFDIPLFRMIQFFLIFVEMIVAIVMWFFARTWLNHKQSTILVMVVIVCNPIAILQVCQHCNFDIIVALWVLLACFFETRFLRTGEQIDWLWVCLFIGLGILTKTTPLILFPILFIGIAKIKPSARLMGIFLVVFPTFLGISILYVLGPEHITNKVLSYRSYSGYFGFTGILNLLSLESFISVYRRLFGLALLAMLTGFSYWLARIKELDIRYSVLLVALLMTTAPIFGPGYAPQYVYWYIPVLGLTFPLFNKQWRNFLIILFVTGIITYLIEYGIFSSHGCYLCHLINSESIVSLSNVLTQEKAQTLIRLPIFLAYLLFFFNGWKLLINYAKTSHFTELKKVG